ncbi:MAG TPA: hypothetical protein VL574_07970, partial [Stellaceae bacterium]|nr:hypothetical protein [Stellaceae bacterium]
FALISIAILLGFAPAALPWASAILIPCLLAAPFACLTAAPWFQRRLSRYGLCAIPEDIVPVVELVPVDPVPEAAE